MKSTRRRPLGCPAGVISTVTGASGSPGRSTCHDFGMSLAFTVRRTVLRFLAVVSMLPSYHPPLTRAKAPRTGAPDGRPTRSRRWPWPRPALGQERVGLLLLGQGRVE